MIAAIPTQEDVNLVARELAPDVVRIRFRIAEDWSGHPAMYFRVILSDEVSWDRLEDVTGRVKEKVFDELGLAALAHIPYFRFRSESEQATLQDAAWD